ncbi:MAG: sulfatase-like hydrolase/transferase, partial [Planctomycetota bacterium]|nr:sulfatase-like hydrolase/transferase [Planctomycetota bacterium]
YPEDHGFEHNVGGFERGHPPKGYFSPYGNPKLTDGPEGEHLTERLTREALAWMDEVRDEPFLLVFCYYTVHTPLQSKPEYAQRYRDKQEAQPADGEAWGEERQRKVRLVQDHAVYAGMVQSLDESVGLVLGALEGHGLSERTVVMFTSDNGGLSTSEGHPTSNMPLRAGKGWVYEGGVRVPLLVRWPGVTTAGSVIDDPAWGADLYPTALAAAGLDLRPTQHLDGLALTPALRGGALPQRALYWHYPHYGNQGGAPSGAVRWGDWKLCEWFEDDRVELFHLGEDEGELRDLASAEPERAAQLRGLLSAWRGRTEANMPRPNPDHE